MPLTLRKCNSAHVGKRAAPQPRCGLRQESALQVRSTSSGGRFCGWSVRVTRFCLPSSLVQLVRSCEQRGDKSQGTAGCRVLVLEQRWAVLKVYAVAIAGVIVIGSQLVTGGRHGKRRPMSSSPARTPGPAPAGTGRSGASVRRQLLNRHLCVMVLWRHGNATA